MTPADFLLLDIGNTSLKLRLATPERLLGRTRRLATAALVSGEGETLLTETLAVWRYRRVILSSVVPDATRKIVAALGEVTPINSQLDTGVNLRGYPGAKTLGADRLANAAGALTLHGPGPLIVVDFGTAATFNALDARGRFLGGVIAPGLATVANALPARTAQLPLIRLTGPGPAAIGRNTRAAMRAGAIIGYQGLVRELLGALQKELSSRQKKPIRVIATGGDALWVAAKLSGIFDAVDTDLTLEGLRIIAARIHAG